MNENKLLERFKNRDTPVFVELALKYQDRIYNLFCYIDAEGESLAWLAIDGYEPAILLHDAVHRG